MADGERSGRDRDNRAELALDLLAGQARHDDGLLDGEEHVVWANARSVERALAAADDTTLWLYDPDAFDGDGRVAIGVGEIDEADHLVVLVPGVGTETADASAQVRRVETLVDAAREQGSEAAAGYFWLGYDAPDGPTDPAMRTTARAEVGGDALASDVAAMQTGADPGDRWTVVGHSYGSTTTSYAATGQGLDVDAVVLVGAPGAGEARRAADLGVDQVFAGRDSRDLVATLGDEGWVGKRWVGKDGLGLGVDPASEEFGAVRFRSERPDRGLIWGLGEAHSGYFTPDGEALDSMGAVIAGRYDRVEVAAPASDPWWGRPRDPEWGRGVVHPG